MRSRDVVFFEHEIGAELLSNRYSTTLELVIDTNDVSSASSSTSIDQLAIENVETTFDGVVEVHLDDDGDVPQFDDAPDNAQPHEEEVHEQGEQPTLPVEDV